MTLTLTLALKIAFWDFVAAGGIFRVSQTHLDFLKVFLALILQVRTAHPDYEAGQQVDMTFDVLASVSPSDTFIKISAAKVPESYEYILVKTSNRTLYIIK